MRFKLIAVAPALAVAALAACQLPLPEGVPSAPVVVADKTVLDEKAAFGAELAYEGFRTAAEIAVDAGLLKGERAAQVAALDARAYQALVVARAAYDAGNAATYGSALANARAAIGEALALIKGPAR